MSLFPKMAARSFDTANMKSASASPVSSGQGAKPLTYTTVGSVVKTDETPTFAPPVRIHREGASRRPSSSLAQSRNPFDSHSSRSHAQKFRSNYTHQQNFLESSHIHNPNPSYSPLNPQASHTGGNPANSSLTTDEQTASPNLGAPPLHERNADPRAWSRPSLTSGSHTPLTNITNTPNQDPIQSTASPAMGIQDQFKGGPQRDAPVPPTGIAGLEPLNKMQSLQRLAQYPNPMQDKAKGCLARFSLSNAPLPSYRGEGASMFELPRLVFDVPPRGKDINTGKNLSIALERHDPKGELEMNYRIPDPLPTQSSTTYSNDTFGDSSGGRSSPITSSDTYGRQTAYPTMARSYPQTQQGYPQPLTAGPPGQRFANHNNNDATLQSNQGKPSRPNNGASRQALVSLQDLLESHLKKDGERNKELDNSELTRHDHKQQQAFDRLLEQLHKKRQRDREMEIERDREMEIERHRKMEIKLDLENEEFLHKVLKDSGRSVKNYESIPPGPFNNNRLRQMIHDTFTPADISKYYPGGIPSDYNYVQPPRPLLPASAATFDSALLHPQHVLQQTTAPTNSRIEPDRTTLDGTDILTWRRPIGDQLRGRETDTTNPSDSQWYSGLRRIGMSAEEHIQEFENKEWRFKNGYPEPTPLPGTATDHKPVTMEQINQTPLSKMLKETLAPAFGTFLSLGARNPSPSASFNLFHQTEDRYRDFSAAGNNSLFGEDWGVTPGQARRQQRTDAIEEANEASERCWANYPPKLVSPDWKTRAAEGQKEGSQLWKRPQQTEPKWTGPHGLAQGRGLDRGLDTADMVNSEGNDITRQRTCPPMDSNKEPAHRVRTSIDTPTARSTRTSIVPPTTKRDDIMRQHIWSIEPAQKVRPSIEPTARSNHTSIIAPVATSARTSITATTSRSVRRSAVTPTERDDIMRQHTWPPEPAQMVRTSTVPLTARSTRTVIETTTKTTYTSK